MTACAGRMPLLFAAFASLFGQSVGVPAVFDAASIRPTPPARQNQLQTTFCSAGGRFSVSGAPPFWSLKYAFRLKDYEIAGAPGWMGEFESAYDIEAKPAQPVDNAQCRLMLQSLFRDRFKLAYHREMRESPVYFLTVGKKGVKMREGGQGPAQQIHTDRRIGNTGLGRWNADVGTRRAPL